MGAAPWSCLLSLEQKGWSAMTLSVEQNEGSAYRVYRAYLVGPGVAQRLFTEK